MTGTICALIAYRKTFAAMWDFRFNHVLLPRSSSLFHRAGKNAELDGQYKFQYSKTEGAMQPPVASEGEWALQLGPFRSGAVESP